MPHDPDDLQDKMRDRILGRGAHAPKSDGPSQRPQNQTELLNLMMLGLIHPASSHVTKPANQNDWQDYPLPSGPRRWHLAVGESAEDTLVKRWDATPNSVHVFSTADNFTQGMAQGPDGLWRHWSKNGANVNQDEFWLFEALSATEAWYKWCAVIARKHVLHDFESLIDKLALMEQGLAVHLAGHLIHDTAKHALDRALSLGTVRGARTAFERERPALFLVYDYVRALAQEGE